MHKCDHTQKYVATQFLLKLLKTEMPDTDWEGEVLWLLYIFLWKADIKHFLIIIINLGTIFHFGACINNVQTSGSAIPPKKLAPMLKIIYKFQKLPMNDDFLIRFWLYLQRPSRETCTHTDKALLWKNEWSLSTVRFFTVLYCLNPCFVLGLHYWLISLNLVNCYPKLLISPLIEFRTLSLSRLFMNWFRVLIINRSLNWI